MARRPIHAPLNVYMNARLVGRLRREHTAAIDFQYDKDWLAWVTPFPSRFRFQCAKTATSATRYGGL